MTDVIGVRVEGAKETAARMLSAQVETRVALRAALGDLARDAADAGESQASTHNLTGNLANKIKARSGRTGNWIIGSRGVRYAAVQQFGGNIGKNKSVHLAPSQVSQWLTAASEEARRNTQRLDALMLLVENSIHKGR